MELYQLQVNRKYYYDSAFETGTMIADIDDLMSRTNETTRLRRHAFSHGIKFT